jgi:hypothetical protein
MLWPLYPAERTPVPIRLDLTHAYNKLNSVTLVHKRTIPTERLLLVMKLVPTFEDRRGRMVSATDSHGR